MSNGSPDARIRMNAWKTGLETQWNVLKGPLALTGIAMLGMHFGIHDLPTPINLLHEIQNNYSQGPIPFLVGLGLGILQNVVLINKTLKNLDKKTQHGTLVPLRKESDGTLVAQITCVDARRRNQSGGAIPGSFAVLGAEITSTLAASLIGKMTPDSNPIANAVVGYAIGSNILTGFQSHIGLIDQISKIVKQAHIQDSKARVKIIMEDHWDGCGAQGFTNILSYLAKFKWHNAFHLADIIGIPNEILGYMYVNSVLSPLVAIASGGQVSLSASVIHSPMHK